MVNKIRGKKYIGGYMTVEAAMVMFVVLMTYVFLIDTVIMQYERCVEELEMARYVVIGPKERNTMYDIKELNPVSVLRLQKVVTNNGKGEEK